jgi:inner membrane protein
MIISSEDFALLMGSVLIFSILAIGMLSTRKVDWYQLSSTNEKEAEKRDLDIKTDETEDVITP